MADLLKIGPAVGREDDYRTMLGRLLGDTQFNNNHWTGPVASAGSKIAGAWLQKSAMDDAKDQRSQVMASLLKSQEAKPWTDPDSGAADPEGFGAGGVPAMLEAIKAMPDNSYAQDLLPGLLSSDIARKDAARQAAAERAREDALYQRERNDKLIDGETEHERAVRLANVNHNNAVNLKGSPGWVPETPGVHTPFSKEVYDQKVGLSEATARGAQAGRVAAQGTWEVSPNDPDVLINNVTNEQKPRPLTPQRAAERALPDITNQSEQLIELVNGLVSHPGLSGVVGMGSLSDTLRLPATDEAGFRSRLAQLEGKQFLQAFESLKGGGSITQIEGQKAASAISRLQELNQSEEEYRAAAKEFQEIIWGAVNRTRKTAGLDPIPMPGAEPGTPATPPSPGGWSIRPVS